MAHPRNIADLEKRIAQATIDYETWRAAGFSEKYMEAYSLIGILEAELEALGRTPGALRGPVEAAAAPLVASVSGDRAQLMADLSIAYDGLRYYYKSYRYDRLEDAVSYARLQRSRVGSQGRVSLPRPAIFQPPGEGERRTMTLFGITYAEGVYRLGKHRYDRLADALAYARLQGRGRADPRVGSVHDVPGQRAG